MRPQEFVKHFSEFSLIDDNRVYVLGREYYLVDLETRKILDGNRFRPSYASIYLGKDTNQGFVPSFFLLDILKRSSKKVMINEKAGWLFVCGRDVLSEGIIKKDELEEMGYLLVLNERKEVLGYGQWARGGVHNLLDRGDFLRREREPAQQREHRR
jgi:ribosome biogenesis protein Nip4